MSNCIKDLYDYDIVKKCSKCGIVKLKSNFHKNIKSSDGLNKHCKNCVLQKQKQYDIENRHKKREYYQNNRDRIKDYYLQNRDRLNNYQKKYNYENKEKINLYIKNRKKTDINFRIIHNTKRRMHHALNDKSKSSSTLDILGIDVETYRNWIEWQMTPEMNWSNIEIDHVKPICMFDVTKDYELKEAFSWKNTQPLLKQDHRQKGIKFNFLDYQLHFLRLISF